MEEYGVEDMFQNDCGEVFNINKRHKKNREQKNITAPFGTR